MDGWLLGLNLIHVLVFFLKICKVQISINLPAHSCNNIRDSGDYKGDRGHDPFNENFLKFRSKTEWIGSVETEKFRKRGSTFRGGWTTLLGWTGLIEIDRSS